MPGWQIITKFNLELFLQLLNLVITWYTSVEFCTWTSSATVENTWSYTVINYFLAIFHLLDDIQSSPVCITLTTGKVVFQFIGNNVITRGFNDNHFIPQMVAVFSRFSPSLKCLNLYQLFDIVMVRYVSKMTANMLGCNIFQLSNICYLYKTWEALLLLNFLPKPVFLKETCGLFVPPPSAYVITFLL